MGNTGLRLRRRNNPRYSQCLAAARVLRLLRKTRRSLWTAGRRAGREAGAGFMHMAGSGSAAIWMRGASGLEVLTGLGLVVAPSLLARLLFGSDLNGAGEAMGRIAGLVMVCLAAGCWPSDAEIGQSRGLIPLAALGWLAVAFLVVSGVVGANVGLLLWPAAALHLILAVLLTRALMESRRG